VAIALQNAFLFAEVQRQAEREALLNKISQKIQGATTIEAVLETAAQEVGRALGAPATRIQLNLAGTRGQEQLKESTTSQIPAPRI
jgi:GAF domain-containing protein